MRIRLSIQYHDKIFQDLDPDRIVAFGAAIQAENLTQKNINTLLLDVNPLSLGVELMGGTVQKIIYRNTALPFLAHQSFTTYEDSQNAIEINILQGERDLAKNCRSLGKFTLSGIPPLPAGVPDVKIQFFIDCDGILTVSAKEQLTGVEQTVQVRPTYGIEISDVMQMIETSMQNAKDDIKQKLDLDQKTEAIGMIKKIQSQMLRYNNLLDEESKIQINTIIEKLQDSLNQKIFDRSTVSNLIIDLNQASSNFVKQILESGIKEGLKDVNLKN